MRSRGGPPFLEIETEKEDPFGAAAVVVSCVCVLHAVVVIPVAAKFFTGLPRFKGA